MKRAQERMIVFLVVVLPIMVAATWLLIFIVESIITLFR